MAWLVAQEPGWIRIRHSRRPNVKPLALAENAHSNPLNDPGGNAHNELKVSRSIDVADRFFASKDSFPGSKKHPFHEGGSMESPGVGGLVPASWRPLSGREQYLATCREARECPGHEMGD